jgi:hypothetical protein
VAAVPALREHLCIWSRVDSDFPEGSTAAVGPGWAHLPLIQACSGYLACLTLVLALDWRLNLNGVCSCLQPQCLRANLKWVHPAKCSWLQSLKPPGLGSWKAELAWAGKLVSELTSELPSVHRLTLCLSSHSWDVDLSL